MIVFLVTLSSWIATYFPICSDRSVKRFQMIAVHLGQIQFGTLPGDAGSQILH